MARRIIKEAKGPYELKVEGGAVRICMCGLSKNPPFCDKSCRGVKDEEEGKVYEYDAEGNRKEI